MTDTAYHGILWGATGGLFAGLVIAGLWPFDFSTFNGVTWQAGMEGMLFRENSIAYTYSPLYSRTTLSENRAISISVALKPSDGSGSLEGRIISFYNPQDKQEKLVIGQWRSQCRIHQYLTGNDDPTCKDITFRTLLTADTWRTIRIIIEQTKIAVYRDDSLVGTTSCMLQLNPMMLMRCRVILGNGPSANTPWEGTLGEINISDLGPGHNVHDRTISPLSNGSPAEGSAEHALAIWKFGGQNEGGRIASDYSGNGNILSIPKRFKIPNPTILADPVKDLSPGHMVPLDLLINFLGFIPFGFVLFLLFADIVSVPAFRALVWVSILGMALSFSIEIAQSALPGRHSQMSDLILNTMGAASGAFFLWRMRRSRE